MTLKIQKIGPVGAVAWAIAGTLLLPSAASAGSWSSQPSWAGATSSGEDSPGPSRRPSSSSYSSRSIDIAPFTPGSHNIAVDLGQVFLMGDLASKYGDSLGTRLHYTYGVSDIFGFDSSFGYSEHSEGRYSMMTLLTGLRTNLTWYDKVVPYLVFGMGFYRPSITTPGTNGGPSSTQAPILFGVHVGPGVDLELTKNLFFGTSLSFHNIFSATRPPATTGGTATDFGGMFASFLLHVGVTF